MILDFKKRDITPFHACDWCKREVEIDEGSFHPALVDLYTRKVLGYMFVCDECLEPVEQTPESLKEFYDRAIKILKKEGYL